MINKAMRYYLDTNYCMCLSSFSDTPTQLECALQVHLVMSLWSSLAIHQESQKPITMVYQLITSLPKIHEPITAAYPAYCRSGTM